MIYLIGDIQIEIVSQEDFLDEKFHPFLLERKDIPSALRLIAHKRSVHPIFGSSDPEQVKVYSRDDKIVIERTDFSGHFDPDTFEADVEFAAKYSLEAFLRVVYALILPSIDGLSIHASSVVRDGKAYLFPGKSGAGKTTITELSPNVTLLTDETSIIRGIGDTPRAYGSPFHGTLEIPGDNISAPVAGIYFPVQDKENFLERLSSQAALWKLLPNVNLFGQDHALVEKAFQLSYELVASLPCYDLHFLPEPDFWDCIDAQAGTD